MKAADRIIDLGPGAGEQGGQMIFSGTFTELLRSGSSLTGKYLKEELKIHVPSARLVPNGQWLKIYGAREHNLKNVEVSIPMGMMTCITGVSGSGKSPWSRGSRSAWSSRGESPERANYDRMEEAMDFGSGYGRSVWADAALERSRTPRRLMQFAICLPPRVGASHSYGAGHFSFNIPGGRCETCEGMAP